MPQIVDLSGLPQPVVDEIQRLVTTLRANLPSSSASTSPLTCTALDEVERGLDALTEASTPMPVLPADFSREDIYAEHD